MNMKELIPEELKNIIDEQLNQQMLLMNPHTGTVQSLELWRTEINEPFIETELYPVKRVNHQWVKVH